MTKKQTKKKKSISDTFNTFARLFSNVVGSPWTFFLALFFVILWIVSGPFFEYSDTWQLVINTTTTIITFLIVFLLQNSQNREAKSIELKLDELLEKTNSPKGYIRVEDLTEKEIEKLRKKIKK